MFSKRIDDFLYERDYRKYRFLSVSFWYLNMELSWTEAETVALILL